MYLVVLLIIILYFLYAENIQPTNPVNVVSEIANTQIVSQVVLASLQGLAINLYLDWQTVYNDAAILTTYNNKALCVSPNTFSLFMGNLNSFLSAINKTVLSILSTTTPSDIYDITETLEPFLSILKKSGVLTLLSNCSPPNVFVSDFSNMCNDLSLLCSSTQYLSSML